MKGPREVKSKMNVDDEMRKPLLLSEEEDDLNGRVRFDSRALSNANQKLLDLKPDDAPKRKLTKLVNPMKLEKEDKFNSGRKTVLLAKRKEKEERE
jgi:hypothetical protein